MLFPLNLQMVDSGFLLAQIPPVLAYLSLILISRSERPSKWPDPF